MKRHAGAEQRAERHVGVRPRLAFEDIVRHLGRDADHEERLRRLAFATLNQNLPSQRIRVLEQSARQQPVDDDRGYSGSDPRSDPKV